MLQPARMRSRGLALPVSVSAVAAAGAILIATQGQLAVTPDSAHYFAAARHLLDGSGLIRLGGEPMASWPPLYPALLSALGLLGITSLWAALIINLLAAATSAAAVAVWIGRRTGDRLFAAIVGVITAVGSPMIFVGTLALTDLLFVAFSLLALERLDAWLATPTRGRLVWCAVAIAMACQTRYTGLALLAAVVIVVMAAGPGSPASRLSAGVTLLTVSGAPLLLWIVRNAAVTGTFFGPRFDTEYTVFAALTDTGQQLLGWFLPWRVATLPLLPPALAAGLAGAAAGAVLWRRPSAAAVCLTFAGTYLALLLYSVTHMQLDVVGDRMLVPVFAPLVAGGALVMRSAWRRWPRTRMAIAMTGLALVAVMATRTQAVVNAAWTGGPGAPAHTNYNAPRWAHSTTLARLRKHPPAGLVFSSSPAALYLHAGLDSRPMPRKHARRSPGVPMDDLDAIDGELAAAGGAFLVILDGDVPTHAFTLDELSSRFAVHPVWRAADGAVYLLARPTAEYAD